MSREVEVLIELGCDILLVIVFMGLIYMIAQWSCESELNTQLDDELENKSIIELRRQRQNLANRSGGNIGLPSPAFSRSNALPNCSGSAPSFFGDLALCFSVFSVSFGRRG